MTMTPAPRTHFGEVILVALLALATTGPQAASISGTVTDEDGAPLADARITAASPGADVQATLTDAEGRYELAGLAAGAYELRAELADFCTAMVSNVSPVAARGRADVAPVDFFLGPEFVEGRPLGPRRLTDAARQADAIVHLGIIERRDSRLRRYWGQISGEGSIGTEHHARAIASPRQEPIFGPRGRGFRLLQDSAGHWSDGHEAGCGGQTPHSAGDEYVALLQWSRDFGAFMSVGPDFIFPVREGRVFGLAGIDFEGLDDGMTVDALLEVLRDLPQPGPPRPIEDPDAYAVYAELFADSWPVRVANATSLVLMKEAMRDLTCASFRIEREPAWRGAVEAFREANRESRTLLPGFDLGLRYAVVSVEEFRAILDSRPDSMQGGWANFYDRYPDSGGFSSVSAVGFGPAKGHAIAMVGHTCGLECGEASLHLLENVDDAWREVVSIPCYMY